MKKQFRLVFATLMIGLASLDAMAAPNYLVTYFRSYPVAATTGGGAYTVISVTNTSTASCNVQVDWKNGGVATPCSSSQTLAPGQQLNFCSRGGFGVAPATLCASSCTGTIQGNATVTTPTSSTSGTLGCADIAVSARTIYTSLPGAGSSLSLPTAITDAKVVLQPAGGASNIGD